MVKIFATKRERREALIAYAFIAPGMLIFLIFVFIPVIAAFYLSFTRYDITHPPLWIGTKNYERILKDILEGGVIAQSLRNTGLYALGVIPTGMALSLLLAMILNEKIRGITFFRAAYYLPVVTSLVAVSMIWMWMYDPLQGLLNNFLNMVVDGIGALGASAGLWEPGAVTWINQRWLGDPAQALWCIVAMSIWGGLGWNMVIYLAGLQAIPEHLYEAAIIDGAGRWQRFAKITWPLLKPTTFFIFVTSVIGASQVFGQVYIMTNGGPNNATTTIVHQIFQNAFSFMKMGYASAMAFVLFVIIFLLSLFNWTFLRSDVEYF